MIRLFFLFLLTLISVIALLIGTWLVWKLLRSMSFLKKRGGEMLDDQVKQWEWRKARKGLPEFFRDGVDAYYELLEEYKALPERWRFALQDVMDQSGALVEQTRQEPDYGNSVRKFFTVTVPALQEFVASLRINLAHMDDTDEEQAMQSIEVFEADLERYHGGLQAKRRFDFQVLTEMIKQRLGR